MWRIFVKPLYDASAAVSIQSTLVKIFAEEKINIKTAEVRNPEGPVRQKSFDLSLEMLCHKASIITYVCQTEKHQHSDRTKSKFIFSFKTMIYYRAEVDEWSLE
jgi:hypothetical protein